VKKYPAAARKPIWINISNPAIFRLFMKNIYILDQKALDKTI
jgi:hypothetical protein